MIELSLFAQVLLWFAMVAVFLASGQASLFHPITVYLIFHGLVFVLRPVLVHGFGFDGTWIYMGFEPTEAGFLKTLAVSSLGLFCFTSACLWVGWSQPSLVGQLPQVGAVEKRALRVTTLLLLPVIAYSIFATRNGIEGERVNGIYIMTHSTGYLNEAQHFIIPLLGAWLVVTRFHWANWPPVLLYVAYRAWFGWSRWTILLFLLMTALVYCWYARRRWLPVWVIAVAVPILGVFNLLGHNRDFLKQLFGKEPTRLVEDTVGLGHRDKIRKQLDTQDYANFDFLSYVVSVVPERTGSYTYGAQYLQLFTEPIPRIVWKGKPVGTPVRTIDLGAYGNFVGLTVSLCGDGWISGGWLGLIVTMSVAGMLLGKAHEWFWANSGNTLAGLAYSVGLAMVPQWYRDGGISIFKFLLFTWFPLALWLAIKWALGGRFVPGYSIRFRPGERVRLIQHRGLCPTNESTQLTEVP